MKGVLPSWVGKRSVLLGKLHDKYVDSKSDSSNSYVHVISKTGTNQPTRSQTSYLPHGTNLREGTTQGFWTRYPRVLHQSSVPPPPQDPTTSRTSKTHKGRTGWGQRVRTLTLVNPGLVRDTTPDKTRDILQLVVGTEGEWVTVIVEGPTLLVLIEVCTDSQQQCTLWTGLTRRRMEEHNKSSDPFPLNWGNTPSSVYLFPVSTPFGYPICFVRFFDNNW